MDADLSQRFLSFAHHDFGIVMAITFFAIGFYQVAKTPNRSKKGFFDYALAVLLICFGIYTLNVHYGFYP